MIEREQIIITVERRREVRADHPRRVNLMRVAKYGVPILVALLGLLAALL